jgi:hypothetical protein
MPFARTMRAVSTYTRTHHLGTHRLAAAIVTCAAILTTTATPVNAQDTNTAAVRSAIKAIWDKPDARVEVDPVSVVKNHAVAGWTQDTRGGRALLRQEHGKWVVILCGGDGLARKDALRQAGVAPGDAAALEAAVAKAEAAIPAPRRKMFALFQGTVRVDGGHEHPAHGAASAHPQHK